MGVLNQDVLVVHPNAGRRAALASALPSHRVVAVESKQEAARRMFDAAPGLILAPPGDTRHFLRQVDQAAPSAERVFLCSQMDVEGLKELVETAAEGHVFSILDDTLSGAELGQTLDHFLKGREPAFIAPEEPFTASFQLQGRLHAARCIRIGNFGATLEVLSDGPITAFLPGTALEAFHIERDGQPILNSDWAQVRQVRPVQGLDAHHLRLGITWGTALTAAVLTPPDAVLETDEVLAVLRKALRRGASFWLQSLEAPSAQFRLEAPLLDVIQERAILKGRSGGLLPEAVGQVLRLSFEMLGQTYSGVVNFHQLSSREVGISAPRRLSLRNRRYLPRFKPGPEHRFLVSFSAPLSGERITRSVLDLSGHGLAFSFDAAHEILPAGSQLETSLLLPDGSAVSCQAEVRSIEALPMQTGFTGDLRPFRAGLRLLKVPAPARTAILSAFARSRCPSTLDGGLASFQGIWSLMQDAGYKFHPDYPFEERGHVEVLADTHRKLYTSGELGGSVVYKGRNDERILGHASGLRIHSRTWLVQHLAVRPGFHRHEQVAHDLISLLVEFGEAMEDIEFIRYSWRRDNRWPNRLGLWLARVIDGQGLSWLRHFEYMRLPLASAPVAPGHLPTVRDAERGDRVWLENHLRARGELVRVVGEDLHADEMGLESLGERFRAHGLHRGRRLFVVDGEDGPLAMALAEEGSPGINLIEKTNAFWLVSPQPGHPRAREAARALIQRCVEHARERGRPSAIAFAADEDIPLLREAGFEQMGRFTEWFFHRSLVRRWCELWKSVFERARRTSKQEWAEKAENP